MSGSQSSTARGPANDARLDFSGTPSVALLDLPTRQHMNEEEAVQKANDAATRHGWNLDRYGHPQLFRWHPDEWQLFYEGSGQPGDWFLVRVNWRTGAIKVHGGY